MLPNEVNYQVSLEQHQDRLRAMERHQLIELAGLQRGVNQEVHRRWLGDSKQDLTRLREMEVI